MQNNNIPSSHGRDGTLKVWQLRLQDESEFSTVLPVEDTTTLRKDPWLLHSLHVNTLTFCSFSPCTYFYQPLSTPGAELPTLLAVPGPKDTTTSIWTLPSEEVIHTIQPPADAKTGMLMALRLLCFPISRLYLLSGWESGLVSIQVHKSHEGIGNGEWQTIYTATPHTQPVLSLDLAPDFKRFFSSGADAIIASHTVPIPRASSTLVFTDADEPKVLETGHAGQQSLVVRSDGRIFATAGWDGRVRVYSSKAMREVAVLKWHKEGCYAVAFAEVLDEGRLEAEEIEEDESGEQRIRESEEGQEIVKKDAGGQVTVAEKRVEETQRKHWLAAGSKDGKVSLWEIY